MNTHPRHKIGKKTAAAIFLVAMFLFGSVVAGLLAALTDIDPEIAGFFARWWRFAWRYGIPVGDVCVLMFAFVYFRQLTHPDTIRKAERI